MATIDSAVERRVRVVQHDVGRKHAQVELLTAFNCSIPRRTISTFSGDIGLLRQASGFEGLRFAWVDRPPRNPSGVKLDCLPASQISWSIMTPLSLPRARK
jgi:hypothetical protein